VWGKSPERLREDSDLESEKEEAQQPLEEEKKKKKSKKDKKKKKKKKKKKRSSSSSDESSSEEEWVEKDVLEVSFLCTKVGDPDRALDPDSMGFVDSGIQVQGKDKNSEKITK
jgi:hypothetical protein